MTLTFKRTVIDDMFFAVMSCIVARMRVRRCLVRIEDVVDVGGGAGRVRRRTGDGPRCLRPGRARAVRRGDHGAGERRGAQGSRTGLPTQGVALREPLLCAPGHPPAAFPGQ